MFRSKVLGLVLTTICSVIVYGQDANNINTPPIAESGGAEIESIKIVRQKVSGAAASADLTNMEVRIWLANDDFAADERFVLQVTELAAIEDSAGNALLREHRRKRMNYLDGEVPVRETLSRDGRSGPVVTLLLDAPERSASTIKSIKGKAIVSRSKIARLEFKDIAAMNHKLLEHETLSNFPIRATVEQSDNKTILKLEVSPQHERLIAWGLVKRNRMLSPHSESESLENEVTILEASYDGDVVGDCSLGLKVAEPVDGELFEFEFNDLELP